MHLTKLTEVKNVRRKGETESIRLEKLMKRLQEMISLREREQRTAKQAA